MNFKIEKLFKLLKNKNLKIAAVESFTGGLFSSAIVSQPGASEIFIGSMVAYHNHVKEALGVDCSNGSITPEAAQAMAIKGKEYFDVDYCVSFTGNAGPDVIEDKPVGLIYISINKQVFKLQFQKMDRQKIQKHAVDFAIKKLEEIIIMD